MTHMQRLLGAVGAVAVVLSIVGCATIRRVYTHDTIKDPKEKDARLKKDTIICRNKANQAKSAAVAAHKQNSTTVYVGSGYGSGYSSGGNDHSYSEGYQAETLAFEACMTEANWTWEDIREEAK